MKTKKDKTRRRVRATLRWTALTLAALYCTFLLLGRLPILQRAGADAIERMLEQKMGSRVALGRITVAAPARLILDDVDVWDLNDSLALHASRASVSVELLPLLAGKGVRLGGIQLFGLETQLYRASRDEPLNIEPLINALARKDSSGTATNLHIGRLLVRRGCITYDCPDAATPAAGRVWNPNHLRLHDISLNAQLHYTEGDSLSLILRKLSLREESGLRLERMQGRLTAGEEGVELTDFEVVTDNSSLSLPHFSATGSSNVLRTDKLAEWIKGATYEGQMEARVVPDEFTPLLPRLKELGASPIAFACDILGRGDCLTLPHLLVRDGKNGERLLDAAVTADSLSAHPLLRADVNRLHISDEWAKRIARLTPAKEEDVERLTEMLCPAEAEGWFSHSMADATTDTDLHLLTPAGMANVKGRLTKAGEVDVHTTAEDLALGTLLPPKWRDNCGIMSLQAHLQGLLPKGDRQPDLHCDGVVSMLEFKGHTYRDLHFDASCREDNYRATASLNDADGDAELQIDMRQTPSGYKLLACYAAIQDFNPHALGLTTAFADESFTLNLDAHLQGTSPERTTGRISVEDLCIHSAQMGDCLADSIVLRSQLRENQQHITLQSPFMTAEASGHFRWNRLPHTLRHILTAHIPGLGEKGGQASTLASSDDISLTAHIQDTIFLSRLTGKPIAVPQPSTLSARIDGSSDMLEFHTQIPELKYANEQLRHIDCHAQSHDDQMQLSLLMERQMKGMPITIGADIHSNEELLRGRMHWRSQSERMQMGEIDVASRFYEDAAGRMALRGNVNQSNLIINDTVWTVHPSHFDLHDGVLDVDSLIVSKGDKYLCIQGRVSEQESDSLMADLHKINLAYIFDLVNFHSVEFDGEATGRVYASHLRSKPRADAFLQVKNFTFNEGTMGDMDVHGNWDTEQGSIRLNALIRDASANHETSVQGRITPGRVNPDNGIDLRVRTRRCNLHFLNKYTKHIFSHLSGRASGEVRIFGPFKHINLEGDMLVDEAGVRVTSLGVDYHLAGDSVHLRPDTIWLRGARLYDNLGRSGMDEHCAIMDVRLMHHYLKNLRYDVRAEARNVLGYDFHDFGDMSFYGTLYATGNVTLSGQSGEMTADISGSPMPGSVLVYNSTSPETLTEAGFITYTSPKPATTPQNVQPHIAEAEETTTDIRLNFNLNVTSDATLRVLMDARSGDNINLHGNGHILANYYNKGRFSMYGTYHVEDGIYKLSLQDVIHKDFVFQPGGTIVFGGNAQQAALNLKATYTVPNVSMDDLSATTLGLSNTRVDCIMNIGGRPLAPVVTFDFDLPMANEDEKNMVRQMVSTEEERNMQVIYLLGIGRFYSYESQYMAGSNQSTTAVNSLLSSSLSSQFNQILSNAMGTDNWSFGANLRTGETGWDQLDVEGILSGRMLNNRLLLNGNFGYRESYYTTNNFIGDFDVRYLLTPSGSIALKAYNQTNDRYFIQSSLTTQGIGLQFKKDFNRWRELLPKKKKKKTVNH
ncbi:MAG: translocation/assembly module TamB [Bacteroidaceae bacterium]|nr:translocation/assembly module TamB [Bacteroidaceae bacterium]